MKRSFLAGVTGVLLALPIGAQDPVLDPRQATLKVSHELTAKGIKIKGSIDMPEGTALRLNFDRQVERMTFTKLQCTIYTEWLDTPPLHTLDVSRKGFEKLIDSAPPGVYRFMISYSKMAQRDGRVRTELGSDYRNWSSSFSATLVDGARVLVTMADDRPKLEGFIAELKSLVDAAEREMEKPADKRNFAAIERGCDATEKKVADFQARSYNTVTPFVIITGINKVRGCAPTTPKLGYEPGTPEGEHAAGGQADFAEGVNDTWQMDLARAFVARARYALERERLVIPLNYVVAAWDQYLNVMGREETVGAKIVDEAKREFETAADVVRANAKDVERDLPEERKRSKDQERMSKWAASTTELAGKMDEFIKLRRGARSVEERAKFDNEDQKAVRQQLEALSQEIRVTPAK